MKNLAYLAKADKNNLVTKKDGSLKKRVIEAIKYCVSSSTKIHFSYYTGSGRHIRLVCYFNEIHELLNVLGYKSEFLNDAPRGGKQGDYLKVSKRAINTILSIYKEV